VSGAHAPFGEAYATTSGNSPLGFTGQLNDGQINNTTYYFPERQYRSSQGRWLSPDPAGLAAADPTNPQSWNRYAYVLNNPLSFIDPTGLSCVYADDGTPGDDGDGKGCSDAGIAPDQNPTDSNGNPDPNQFANDDPLNVDGGSGPTANAEDSSLADSIGYADPFGGVLSPSNGRDCTVGPLNLTQNMKTAKSLAGQMWSGLLNAGTPGGIASAGAAAGQYIGLVHTGGAWDPKNTVSLTPENFAAGNINFGATCSQFGFNTSVGGFICQVGAGLYQYHTDGRFASPFFSRYHGDLPRDNMQIRQGLAIAKKGGC